MSDEATGGAAPPEPGSHALAASSKPSPPPSPKASSSPSPKASQAAVAADEQAEARAEADAHDPGNLDGLVTALTSEMERRSRTLQATALEAAWQHLAAESGRTQIGNQVFNVYGAGAFGRGEHGEHGERGAGSQAIPRGTLARARDTFVTPPGYPKLWRNIEENSFLVLKAAAGSGRDFAMLHLLDAVCDGRVRRFPQDVELSQLVRQDFAEGTGYLLERLPRPSALAARADQLEALSERLRSRNARMVIITADVGDWSPAFTMCLQGSPWL